MAVSVNYIADGASDMPFPITYDATIPQYRAAYHCKDIVQYMSMGNSAHAYAGVIGISKDTLDGWAKTYPEFAEAIKRGIAAAVRWWENQHKDASRSGRSAGPAQFALKNLAPKDWRDKTEIAASISVTISQAELTRSIQNKFARLIEHDPTEAGQIEIIPSGDHRVTRH